MHADAHLPDIALIVADDLDLDSISAYGSTQPFMPNLDALSSRRGAVALSAYSVSAICTPSRVGLLTGRYPSRMQRDKTRTGRMSNIDFQSTPEGGYRFQSNTTIAGLLKSSGYRTGFVGKWHMGAGDMGEELRIRTSCGYFAPSETVYLNQSCAEAVVRSTGGFDVARFIYYNNDVMAHRGHHPESLIDASQLFVRSSRLMRKPLFLWVSFTLPHQPLDFASQLQSNSTLTRLVDPEISPQPESVMRWRGQRLALVQRLRNMSLICGRSMCRSHNNIDRRIGAAWLDASLPPLLDELSTGNRNALTIFTVDHGSCYMGKFGLYEGGVRVPLLVHYAGHRAGCAQQSPVTHLDLLPTLASLADASAHVRNADGRNLASTLWPEAGCRSTSTQRALYFEMGYARAVMLNRSKLIRIMAPPGPEGCRNWFGDMLNGSSGRSPSARSVPKPFWNGSAFIRPTDLPVCQAGAASLLPATKEKCVADSNTELPSATRFLCASFRLHSRTYCDTTQLYDLATDPLELHNLVLHPSIQVDTLSRLLEEHISRSEKYVP